MNVNPKSSIAYKLLHDGTLALARAEQAGIRIDMDYAEAKRNHLTRKIERMENQLKETKFYRHWAHVKPAGPNIYSNQQLAHFLYFIKKIEAPNKTRTGQGSTDEETLRQLNIPELNDLIQIRKLKKIRDTYLDAFIREQVNGVIHPSFNLHLVRTFRSSSDHPNFQNIPKRDKESMRIVRKAMYPRLGHQFFSADFSNLEVRIAACYHKDPTMLKYIEDKYDMHGDMAGEIFKISLDQSLPGHSTLRNGAKNGFVFPQFYGDYFGNNALSLIDWGKLPNGRWKPTDGIEIGDTTLGKHMIDNGIKSMDSFTKHLKNIEDDFWGKRFREYAAWKERWWQTYQKHGYISMLTGFNCSGLMGKNDVINYPVQGAAFHCLLWCFIELDKIAREEGWDTKLVGQIHDEIVMDLNPNELTHVANTIQRISCYELPKAWDWIITPLEIEMDICPVDGSWADKEKFCL